VDGREDPLFILYTSGSTGKPKGVLHTTGGYLVYASMTHELVFDYKHRATSTGAPPTSAGSPATATSSTARCQRRHDADVRGHADCIPTPRRFWQVIDKHQVNDLLHRPDRHARADARGRRAGEEVKRDAAPAGSVGEPINPEGGSGTTDVVGDGAARRRHLVADRDRRHPDHAAARRDAAEAGLGDVPFFGVRRCWSTTRARSSKGNGVSGNLCLAGSWPGQMRTVYGDHARFQQTYFTTYPGKYFTGDGCRRDEDGYYWITGRVDDVINVSGHRLGTAEVESALVAHEFWPRPRWSGSRTTSRARASTPT
jgi:acetyl-CoA synthetase